MTPLVFKGSGAFRLNDPRFGRESRQLKGWWNPLALAMGRTSNEFGSQGWGYKLGLSWTDVGPFQEVKTVTRISEESRIHNLQL